MSASIEEIGDAGRMSAYCIADEIRVLDLKLHLDKICPPPRSHSSAPAPAPPAAGAVLAGADRPPHVGSLSRATASAAVPALAEAMRAEWLKRHQSSVVSQTAMPASMSAVNVRADAAPSSAAAPIGGVTPFLTFAKLEAVHSHVGAPHQSALTRALDSSLSSSLPRSSVPHRPASPRALFPGGHAPAPAPAPAPVSVEVSVGSPMMVRLASSVQYAGDIESNDDSSDDSPSASPLPGRRSGVRSARRGPFPAPLTTGVAIARPGRRGARGPAGHRATFAHDSDDDGFGRENQRPKGSRRAQDVKPKRRGGRLETEMEEDEADDAEVDDFGRLQRGRRANTDIFSEAEAERIDAFIDGDGGDSEEEGAREEEAGARLWGVTSTSVRAHRIASLTARALTDSRFKDAASTSTAAAAATITIDAAGSFQPIKVKPRAQPRGQSAILRERRLQKQLQRAALEAARDPAETVEAPSAIPLEENTDRDLG